MAKRRRRQGPSHSTLATPPCAGDIKNNEVPPAQRNKKNDSEVPPAERKKTIDEASAMLLYEAPSGIAIFCFDGEYLEKPVKDFWSALPQLSLEFFLKYKRVSTPFDLDNGTVDNFLAKRLTKLCGTKKKLAVGGAEHTKGIIDAKLGITCLYVGVPDCEVISCLKNPNRTLLPEEKSETWGRNCLRSGKELVKFSHHYDFQVKPEVVNESIVELTGLLHGIELREMEHLKFLRILLKDFLILSGIGTNWSLIELATLLKMICYREASYEGSCPVQIFSSDEYQKIEVNASQYKTSFSRIDVLSVYEDVISLDIAKDILLLKLDILVDKKAKEIPEKAEVTILPTGVKVGKEGNSNVDDRLNSIAEDNCSEVTLVDGKLDFSSERPLVDANQIRTISDEHSSMEKPNINEEIYNKEDANCLIPDKIPEKLSANRDGVERKAGLQTRDDYGQKLTASAIGLLGIKKDEHTNTSVKETNLHGKFADDEKNKQPRGTQGIPDTSMSSKSERHNQKDVIPATSEVPKSGPLKDLNGDGKKKTASTPGGLGKQDEHTDSSNPVGENKGNKQARDTDVQSMDDCAKKQTASALGNKKDENTNTSVKETNLHGKFGDDEKKSSPEVLKGFLTES